MNRRGLNSRLPHPPKDRKFGNNVVEREGPHGGPGKCLKPNHSTRKHGKLDE